MARLLIQLCLSVWKVHYTSFISFFGSIRRPAQDSSFPPNSGPWRSDILRHSHTPICSPLPYRYGRTNYTYGYNSDCLDLATSGTRQTPQIFVYSRNLSDAPLALHQILFQLSRRRSYEKHHLSLPTATFLFRDAVFNDYLFRSETPAEKHLEVLSEPRLLGTSIPSSLCRIKQSLI